MCGPFSKPVELKVAAVLEMCQAGLVFKTVERLFTRSVFLPCSGQIKSALRSRLGHAVADKLVYVHEALHLKHKLQKASYTQQSAC